MKGLLPLRYFVSALLIVGLVFGSFNPAIAAEKKFYDGKTMVLIVPTNPGGGYDFYGRTIAKLMQEELPGSTIIVKNVPGAGNIIGVNELYRSKPDGLTIAIINPGLISAQLINQQGIRFDLKKMSWLGATGESPYGLIVSSAKFKNFEEVKKADPLLIACGGIGTLSYVIPMMASELKILENTKIMLGYRGAQAELAMMQGNIDGQWASWSALNYFVKEGHGFPVIFVQSKPKGYENVPKIEDIVKERKYKSVIDFMETLSAKLIRCFIGPPKIPPDRLQTLQQVFRKVTQGSKYEGIMLKSGYPGGYISPEEQEKLVMGSFDIPTEHVEIIKAAYSTKK